MANFKGCTGTWGTQILNGTTKSSKKCQLGEVPVGVSASWGKCQLGDKNLTLGRTIFFPILHTVKINSFSSL